MRQRTIFVTLGLFRMKDRRQENRSSQAYSCTVIDSAGPRHRNITDTASGPPVRVKLKALAGFLRDLESECIRDGSLRREPIYLTFVSDDDELYDAWKCACALPAGALKADGLRDGDLWSGIFAKCEELGVHLELPDKTSPLGVMVRRLESEARCFLLSPKGAIEGRDAL